MASKFEGYCKVCRGYVSTQLGNVAARPTDSGFRVDSLCRKCRGVRARDLKYGLPPGEYDRMAGEQGWCCAICRRKEKLCVDHSHETGAVRGLLCRNCNSGLGLFRDDSVVLLNAVRYLYDNNGVVLYQEEQNLW